MVVLMASLLALELADSLSFTCIVLCRVGRARLWLQLGQQRSCSDRVAAPLPQHCCWPGEPAVLNTTIINDSVFFSNTVVFGMS